MLTERSGRETPELTLRLLEYLALEPHSRGVTELAQAFGTSKTTIYRHLRVLAAREFVRQDPITLRYEAGIKLFCLGESLRERFGIVPAARSDMVLLRDETGQAVTISALIENRVVVLELLPGLMVVEFGIRPGTPLDPCTSAHGKATLAFGPAAWREQVLQQAARKGAAGTGSGAGATKLRALGRELELIRKRGWASAANGVMLGVNAIAAPIRGHRGEFAGAVAIVGSIQFIPARPKDRQIAQVTGAAKRISRQLGWRGD